MRNLRRALATRFDRYALQQLRAEVARLAQQNEALLDRCAWAEQQAGLWRDDAIEFQLQLCERTGAEPGIRINGTLCTVQGAPL